MSVNPTYRDFLAALDAIERGADRWAAYEQHYLSRHRELLRAYWRQCWGADEERVREMVREMRPGDYRALRQALEHADVDQLSREALDRCAPLVGLPEPQVDLLVGRFSPDAFLLEVEGGWHIGVGLERFAHFWDLPLFIAHEYGHYARRMLAAPPQTLGDLLVAEGAAVAFAQAAYPERQLARHLRMKRRRLHEIREQEPRLWQALKPHLQGHDIGAFAGLVYGGRGWSDFPPRAGACLGYWAVREFAETRGEPATSCAVVAAEAASVLDEYIAKRGAAE
jgi:hypothetical protein